MIVLLLLLFNSRVILFVQSVSWEFFILSIYFIYPFIRLHTSLGLEVKSRQCGKYFNPRRSNEPHSWSENAQSEKTGFKTVSLGQRMSLCYFSPLINVSFWWIIFSEPYSQGRLIGFQSWVILRGSVSSRLKAFVTSEICFCCGKSRRVLLETFPMSTAKLSVPVMQSARSQKQHWSLFLFISNSKCHVRTHEVASELNTTFCCFEETSANSAI